MGSLGNARARAPCAVGSDPKADTLARIIQRRASEIGLMTKGYSAHSTRVGAAQDLLAAGEDLLGMMNAGAWKNPRMPARYGERLLASRAAVARVRQRKKGPE